MATAAPRDGASVTTATPRWRRVMRSASTSCWGASRPSPAGGQPRGAGPAASHPTHPRFPFFVGPKVDYLFWSASPFRPFVGAIAGVERSNRDVVHGIGSMIGAAVQGRAGVRCFAAPGFSIDPALFFEGVYLGMHDDSHDDV